MVSMHRDVCFLKQNNNWSKLRGIVSTAHMKLADCNHVVLKASWLPSHSFGVFQRCHDVLGLLILHVLVELRKTLSLRLSCYDAFCYQSNGVCPHIFEEAMRFVFALGLVFVGFTYCYVALHILVNHWRRGVGHALPPCVRDNLIIFVISEHGFTLQLQTFNSVFD